MTIFALLVVLQAIAYGERVEVAPVVGFYTATGVLVGYELFGCFHRLMLVPKSSPALLVAAAVAPVVAGGSSAHFALLAVLLELLI